MADIKYKSILSLFFGNQTLLRTKYDTLHEIAERRTIHFPPCIQHYIFLPPIQEQKKWKKKREKQVK